MKTKEQLQQLQRIEYQYRMALTYSVIGRVEWFGGNGRAVSTVGGMPKQMIRIGITKSSDPLVIVHYVDSNEVVVITPDQLAERPWPMIDAFGPALGEFLRKNVDLHPDVNVHVPSEAWVRRETAEAVEGRVK